MREKLALIPKGYLLFQPPEEFVFLVGSTLYSIQDVSGFRVKKLAEKTTRGWEVRKSIVGWESAQSLEELFYWLQEIDQDLSTVDVVPGIIGNLILFSLK